MNLRERVTRDFSDETEKHFSIVHRLERMLLVDIVR